MSGVRGIMRVCVFMCAFGTRVCMYVGGRDDLRVRCLGFIRPSVCVCACVCLGPGVYVCMCLGQGVLIYIHIYIYIYVYICIYKI